MLFSELNRLKLNVFLKNADQIALPDIEKIHVHNAIDWTLFCKDTDDIADLDKLETYDAFSHELSDEIIPNFYLLRQWTDHDKIDAIFSQNGYPDIEGENPELYFEPNASQELIKLWCDYLSRVRYPDLFRLYSEIAGKFLRDRHNHDHVFQINIDDANGKLVAYRVDGKDKKAYDRFAINDQTTNQYFIVEIFDGNITISKASTSAELSAVSTWNGWNLYPQSEDVDREDSYLHIALDTIKGSIKLVGDDDSDIIQLYSGPTRLDGTLDFDAFLYNKGVFGPAPNFDMFRRNPAGYFGGWWTFSNGAFQWCNGPKSIFECRFSYGPFGPGPHPHWHGVDPHHFDKNDKYKDDFISKSIVPNLVFIFDKMHELKGIVSLPCIDDYQRQIEYNFIENFQEYSRSMGKLSFKNIDQRLKEFASKYVTIPTIHVAVPPEEIGFEDHETILNYETSIDDKLEYKAYHYIREDADKMLMDFFNRSIWSTYSFSDSIDSSLSKMVLPVVIRDRYFIDKRRDFNAALANISYLFRNADEIERRFKPERDMIFILPTDVIKAYGTEIIGLIKSAKKSDVQASINAIFEKLDEIDKRISVYHPESNKSILKGINII